jgi:hypothetical protein
LKTVHDNPILFTDDYNNNPCNRGRSEYIETRHDQSILSIISKLYGTILVGKETVYGDSEFPFLETRIIDKI